MKQASNVSPSEGLRFTPTVKAALDALSSHSTSSSWDIVREILSRHPEYGDRKAKQLAESAALVFKRQVPARTWLADVQELFDPEMVEELHGRLVILGLCRLDEELRSHLAATGFTQTLEDELREDFLSLLALRADDPDAYRNRFLKLLTDLPRGNRRPGSTANNGFFVIVEGGPGLSELARLCFRQSYTTCFTARYVLTPAQTLTDALRRHARDLRGLGKGDTSTIGDLQPDPAAAGSPWSQLVAPTWLSAVAEPEANDVPVRLLRAWHDRTVLGAGRMLVLFAEFRGAPESAAAAGLDHLPTTLPEGVGMVLSGLPSVATAGFQGPDVLRIKLPPDPDLWRGQPLANDVPDGADRLRIATEVNALAEAIALRKMEPPLVVGVLGGWGSGKSFVLHLLQRRIDEIRCERVDEDFPFVGHPYVIRFDAWTYAKSDLWASLMQEIFIGLDRQLTLEQQLCDVLKLDLREGGEIWGILSGLAPEERDRLTKTELGQKAIRVVARLDRGEITERRLWDTLEAFRREEVKQLGDAEEKLRKSQRSRDERRGAIESGVDRKLEEEVRTAAWTPLKAKLGTLGKKAFEKSAAPTFEQLSEAATWSQRFLLGLKEEWPFVVTAAAVAAAGLLFGKLETALSQVAVLGGGITAALGPVLKARQWLAARHSEYQEEVRAARAAVTAGREARLDAALRDDPDLRKAEEEFRGSEAEVAQRRQRIGITARHRSLLDFVRQRIEGRFYEEKLGLLHQIQSDLTELTAALMPREGAHVEKLFPRGEPRVILMIDDLDRCPPGKVVQVLEAAQLLVKTPLFVVVLSMDVRYVTRALEKEYEDVLVRSGEPSGLDYIEKIIQIPYRLRSASAPAVGSFLRAQMEVEEPPGAAEAPAAPAQPAGEAAAGAEEEKRPARATGATRTELRVLPTKVLKFDPAEHEAIRLCCTAVSVSPRTIKRLANVFKLMKILWYRQGMKDGPAPEVKRAMLALLAVAARFPEPMRRLLQELQSWYARAKDLSGEVAEFLAGRCSRGARQALFPADWLEMLRAFHDPAFFPPKLTFQDLQEENLNLVISFSFVAETDPEREAALRGVRRQARPEEPTEPAPGKPASGAAQP